MMLIHDHGGKRRHGLIRRLRNNEMPLFAAHLIRLEPAARHSRFCGPMSDEAIRRYALMPLREGDVVLGLWVDGEPRAAGELRPDGASTAELAFSVERELRGQGIATTLMERLLRIARTRRLTACHVIVARGNAAMLRLVRKFDGTVEYEGDEITGTITPPRVPLSDQLMDDAEDLIDSYGRAARSIGGAMLATAGTGAS